MSDSRPKSPYVRLNTKFSFTEPAKPASKGSISGNWKKKDLATMGEDRSISKKTEKDPSVNKNSPAAEFKSTSKLKSMSPKLGSVMSSNIGPGKKDCKAVQESTTRKSSTSTTKNIKVAAVSNSSLVSSLNSPKGSLFYLNSVDPRLSVKTTHAKKKSILEVSQQSSNSSVWGTPKQDKHQLKPMIYTHSNSTAKEIIESLLPKAKKSNTTSKDNGSEANTEAPQAPRDSFSHWEKEPIKKNKKDNSQSGSLREIKSMSTPCRSENPLLKSSGSKDSMPKSRPNFSFKVPFQDLVKSSTLDSFDPLASFEKILSQSKNDSYFDKNPLDREVNAQGYRNSHGAKSLKIAYRTFDSMPIEERVEEEQEESRPATLRGSLLFPEEKSPSSPFQAGLPRPISEVDNLN